MSNYKKEDVAVLSLLAVLLVFNGYYASMLIIGPSSSSPAPASASTTTSAPTPATLSFVGTTSPPTPSTITSCDQIQARNFPIDPDNDPYNLDGDGDGIACEDPGAPTQHAVPPPPLNDDNTTTTTSPPGSSSSSPFIEPPPPEERGQVNAIGNVTTLPTTANGTTKTDGLLTATINGTRFTTNQTILINGTLGGGERAGADGTLFIELRDPRNETLLYDSTNMTTGSSFDTPFSYSLIAGDLEKNNGGGGVTTTRTVFKPMNETADNYTMVVGYDAITSSANNNNSSTTRSSEVQFAFAYEHVVARGGGVLSFPASPATGNATTTTTNATTPSEPEPEPEPVQPPVQPPPTREPEPEPVPHPQPEEEEQEEEESEEEQLERLHELLQEEIDDEDDED